MTIKPKIIYHYHMSVSCSGNDYYAASFWVKYINSLANIFEVTILSFNQDENNIGLNDYKLLDPSIKVINLGKKPKKLISWYIKYFYFWLSYSKKNIIYDYLFIDWPTPLSLLFIFTHKFKQLVVFIVGDSYMPLAISKPNKLKLILCSFNKNLFFFYALFKQSVFLGDEFKSHLFSKEKFNFVPILKNTLPYLAPTYTSNEAELNYKKFSQSRLNKINYNIELITFCRLSEEKGISELITIANELKRIKISFKWHIIGEGKLNNWLIESINKNNLSSSILLEAWKNKEDLNRFILDTRPDLFVELPTEAAAGPGRAPWEAMSYGIPCVLQKYSQHHYFINHFNSILPESNKSIDFAKAIKEYSELDINKKNKIIKNSANIAKSRGLDKEIDKLLLYLGVKIK